MSISPTSASPTILVVDDEPSMLRYMRTMLEVESFKVETVNTGAEALKRLEQDPAPSLVLLDVLMPGLDGLETLEQLRQTRPEQKVIMLSCVSDTRKVVQAMRLGAQDYLTKPFQRNELTAVIRRSLEPPQGYDYPAGGEIDELGDDLFFLAASPAMRKLRAQASLVANVDIPVLLLGESGTGKEVLARLIHKMSSRSRRTFLKVNCAALPADLLESELFGYEPGAFTGAAHSKPGKFELCDKGTFLLDEIGEMPPVLQAKLLHVLQDNCFSRLGSRTTIKVDVRIIAATNVDIQQAIASRKLREDLYYRLNAFVLSLPPLRDRREEIPILLKHFLARQSELYARPPLALSNHLLEACLRYSWPGNLRELGNFVKRYLILRDEDAAIAELEHKASGSGATNGHGGGNGHAIGAPGDLKQMVRGMKDEAEAEAIARALDQTRWNRKEAARMLNISYKALLYKIRQYGIEAPAGSSRALRTT
ncbi:MAG: sigma-54 dependent transcriptional regulator [Acidobacteria bacterium]|nr:sigma-54 dependent transcriptional regulator [Acidobacteriota bacterium]